MHCSILKNKRPMENYIRYKGRGEHSVKQLEEIIEQREEELYRLKIKNNEPVNFAEWTKRPQ